MVAAILHPDMGALFPKLRYPQEAAFLLTAHEVLPRGMLGLLVCGIFAATLTHSDAILNQGAGMFVRNFYLPVVDPHCPEQKLLRISKIATAVLGLLIIGLAVIVGRYRSLGLFDLLNQLGISLLLPLAIPACLGMFFRRTPAWSSWTTVLIGLAGSYVATFALRPEMFTWLPGWSAPFKKEETTLFYNVITVAIGLTIPVGWFFFTSLFYEKSPAAFRASVDELFQRMATPLLDEPEKLRENREFPATVGRFCLFYGGLVAVFALIPNPLTGRLCFVGCGGLILLVGVLLRRHYGRPMAPAPVRIQEKMTATR